MPNARRRRKDHESRDVPVSTSAAAGDISAPLGPPRGEPTHDEIARHAYFLYEQRGGAPGAEWDDWFRAERELREANGRNRSEPEPARAGDESYAAA